MPNGPDAPRPDRSAAGNQKMGVLRQAGGLLLRGFGFLTEGLNSAASVWVCVLMLIICADIASRGLLNHPLPGVAEVVSLSIVALVFLQLAHTLRIGRMAKVELFVDMLARRSPRLAAVFLLVANVLGVAIFAAILYGSTPIFLKSLASGEYVGVQGTFTAPTWPAKLAIVIGSALMCIQYTIDIFQSAALIFIPAKDDGARAGTEF